MNILFVHSSLDDWDLTPQAFRVAGHIARRTDGGKSTQKMPGRESMMRVTRLTKEKLTDALAELEYCGILGIDRRDGKVNRYTLLPQSRWRRKVPGDEWKYTTSLRKKREKAGLPCDDEGGTNQGGNPTGLEIQPGRKSNPGPGRKKRQKPGWIPGHEGNPRR